MTLSSAKPIRRHDSTSESQTSSANVRARAARFALTILFIRRSTSLIAQCKLTAVGRYPINSSPARRSDPRVEFSRADNHMA